MNDPFYIFYHSAMLISLILSAVIMLLMWTHRKANGAHAMMALAAGTFIWTLGYFIASYGDTLEFQEFFTKVGYMGSLMVPAAWFVFSVNYLGERKIITRKLAVLISVLPFTFCVLIWTNQYHHLFWYDVYLTTTGVFTITQKTYGIVFWIALVHNYILVVTGSAALLRRMIVGVPIFTKQAVLLLLAVCLPLVWNVVYVFNIGGFPRKDLTPVAFAFSGFIVVYALMRLNLFAAVPFSREFLTRHMRDGIVVLDSADRLVEVNPMAMKILDLDSNDIGQLARDLSGQVPVLEQITRPDFAHKELQLEFNGESRIFDVELTWVDNKRGDRVGKLIVFRDITERREMREQLIAQDRLASIGELTSGVAHEINNPLAVIKGFVELLLQRDFPEDVKADIEIINSEVDRAARIVLNLLTFSRKQAAEKSLVDVNNIVEKTLELRVYEQAGDNIRTVLNLAPKLPMILGSELQLLQVFLNLVINAEYFMKKAHSRGILTVTTEILGESVRVVFHDDGTGISPEDISRIFDPFFTTKEVGKGTGLGLSICYGIVSEHGGSITVESIPGEGTTFILLFPAYEQSAAD